MICYVINGVELWLEQVLAEYDYPVLCTCIDKNNNRYLSLCSDPDKGKYIVAHISCEVLLKMLNNSITMIEAFKKADCIYGIVSNSDDPSEDIVTILQFSKIDKDDLPDESAYFNLLSSEKDLRKYIERLKN